MIVNLYEDGQVRQPGHGGGGQLRGGDEVQTQGDQPAGGHQEVPRERRRQGCQENRHAGNQNAPGLYSHNSLTIKKERKDRINFSEWKVVHLGHMKSVITIKQ